MVPGGQGSYRMRKPGGGLGPLFPHGPAPPPLICVNARSDIDPGGRNPRDQRLRSYCLDGQTASPPPTLTLTLLLTFEGGPKKNGRIRAGALKWVTVLLRPLCCSMSTTRPTTPPPTEPDGGCLAAAPLGDEVRVHAAVSEDGQGPQVVGLTVAGPETLLLKKGLRERFEQCTKDTGINFGVKEKALK